MYELTNRELFRGRLGIHGQVNTQKEEHLLSCAIPLRACRKLCHTQCMVIMLTDWNQKIKQQLHIGHFLMLLFISILAKSWWKWHKTTYFMKVCQEYFCFKERKQKCAVLGPLSFYKSGIGQICAHLCSFQFLILLNNMNNVNFAS